MSVLELRFPKRALAVVAVLALLASLAVSMDPASASGDRGLERAGEVIPDHFIVTLVDGADADDVAEEFRGRGAGIDRVYDRVLNGFAGEIPPGLVRKLTNDPRVASVEPDVVIHGEELEVQEDPPSWGLDRVDQRERPLDQRFGYSAAGQGVRAYVLDTGVRSTHLEFGGRVASGFDAYGEGTTEDCHGHGTHVAGTVASSSFGIAKQATIVPVRVLRCDNSGTASAYYGGIDWILANHPTGTPGVANMSLSTNASSKVDAAARKLVDGGVVVAVAAGNQSTDACTRSPAREPSVLTVAATVSSDARASFSNFGTCVGLFAPGSSIQSTRAGSDTATGYGSGTSMAAPHVAGAAAVLFGLDPGASAHEITQIVLESATRDMIDGAGEGTPNRLVYVDPDLETADSPEPEPNAAPEASFQVSCNDLACDLDASGSTDSDGEIVSYTWRLGDGTTTSGVKVGHTYAASGSYTVELTATDDDGDTNTARRTVEVAEPQPEPSDPEPSDPEPSDPEPTDPEPTDPEPSEAVRLTADVERSGPNWSSTVRAATSAGAQNQVIAYRWVSGRGDEGDGQCTTDSSGRCSFSTLTLPNRDSSVTYTVTAIDATPISVPDLSVVR